MDIHTIQERRDELKKELALLTERFEMQSSEISTEISELDIAERVWERLSGTKRSSAFKPTERNVSTAPKRTKKEKLTVRQMINAALMDARQRNLPGLLPKEIRSYIQATYEQDIGQQINTTASRMWHDLKEIEKDEESGLYRLPKEKPVDAVPGEVTSTGLFDQPSAQGREAGPGGAT